MCLHSQLLAVCLLSEGQRLYLHWCHKVISSTSRLCNNWNLSLRIDGISFDRSGYQWLWFSPLWPHLFSQIYGARSGWLYFYLFRHVYYQMSFVYLYNIDTGAQLWHLMFSIPICQVTAPYLHIGGVVLMSLLSWPIALHVFRISMRGKDEFLVYFQYPK